MSFKLFIDCEKAGHFCDKTQYNESSFWEIIKLNIHMLFCKPCKQHGKSNLKLTRLLKKANIQTLSNDKKQSLQQLINEEMSK